MKILITGHKGFIGTAMVPYLQSLGHAIRGIDSDLYRNSTYGSPPKPIEEIIKDVRDIEPADLEGIEAVVNLAALSNDVLGDFNPEITYDINYRAGVRLAGMAKDLGIGRYVFASSCSMYGATAGEQALDETAEFNPVTAYAKSKVLLEGEVSQMASDGFSPTFMRNATAYGVSPRIRFDVVINNLTAWAFTTGHVHMKSDGTPWRPVVHIEDISRAVAAVLAAPREKVHNEAFNVGRNSENFQIRELAGFVAEAIPGSEISFAEGAGPDTRNYRVNFDKYEQAFPDFPLQKDARSGTREICEAYRRIGLGREDYEGPRYKRIAQLKSLIASGQLDESLRWVSEPGRRALSR